MKIKSIYIGKFKPEDGPSGKRFIVEREDGWSASILIDPPPDTVILASALRELSDLIASGE